jgi:flagellar motor switch protein FliN
MKTYLDCWKSAANSLFPQALAGSPQLSDSSGKVAELSGPAFIAEVQGDVAGRFIVILEPRILHVPLLGEGADQASAWGELLREVAEAAAGQMLATRRRKCRIERFGSDHLSRESSCALTLNSADDSWRILIRDEVHDHELEADSAEARTSDTNSENPGYNRSVELFTDVELEVSLRFGCREMLLGEILELGPGDVVELDRHVTDPVDFVVGDKIVARGEVVLVNGNFGLRVIEVAAPQKRLESVRCLF